MKQDLERRRRRRDDPEPDGSILCRQENMRDLISFISSSSLLGDEPSPDAFIHCCRVRHSAKARKQTRIWAWVLSFF